MLINIILENYFFPDKDVNDCQNEGKKCWEITPAVMAGEETMLDEQSLLRALG